MGARSLLLLIWVAAALTVYLCDLECLVGGLDCHAEAGIACTAPVCHLDDALPGAPALLPAPPPPALTPLVTSFVWLDDPLERPACAWVPRSRPRAPPAA